MHQVKGVVRWFKGDNPIGNAVGFHKNDPGVPPAPTAPTIDTAANLTQQQDDLRARQRGVLSNIYAGNNAPAPVVASKNLLGS